MKNKKNKFILKFGICFTIVFLMVGVFIAFGKDIEYPEKRMLGESGQADTSTFLGISGNLGRSGILGESYSSAFAVYPTPQPGDFLSTNLQKYDTNVSASKGVSLFSDVGQYHFQVFGNSNVGGYDRGGGYDRYTSINMDPTLGTMNSTSMDYVQEGETIKRAFLYVSQSWFAGTPPQTRSGYIMGPSGRKVFLDDPYIRSNNGNTVPSIYYDITEFIELEGSGTYWGVDFDYHRKSPTSGAWDVMADWQIIVVEEDHTFNYRQASINGHAVEFQRQSRTVSTNDTDPTLKLYPPSVNISGQYLATMGGGNSSFTGDQAIIRTLKNNAVLKSTILSEPDAGRSSNDFFQGIISKNGKAVTTRSPYRKPTNIDLAVSEVGGAIFPPGFDNVSFTANTDVDRVYLFAIGISVDIGVPDLEVINHIKGTTNDVINFSIGRNISISTSFKNSTNGFRLNKEVFSVTFPEGATYNPASLVVTGVTTVTSSYDPVTRTLTIPIKPTTNLAGVKIEYSFKSDRPMKSSQIYGELHGENVLPNGTITDMPIMLSANDITLNPGYPINVKCTDAETNTPLLVDSQLHGNYGLSYTAVAPTIADYKLKSTSGNPKGTYKDEEQTVEFFYESLLTSANVIYRVNETPHYDIHSYIITGKIGDFYTTNVMDFPGFKNISTPQEGIGMLEKPHPDIIYYYERMSYNLLFNANSGIGSMPAQSFKYEEEKKISKNLFTRAGYEFQGWATSATGPVVYQDESLYKFTQTSHQTLYAVWKSVSFPVTFDADGGTPIPTNITNQLVDTHVPNPAEMLRPGYIFKHWEDITTPGTSWIFSVDKMPPRKLDLKAIWVPVPITINYHSNGATGQIPSVTAFTGDIVPEPDSSPLENIGKKLDGWYTSSVPNPPSDDLWDFTMPIKPVPTTIDLYANWIYDPDSYGDLAVTIDGINIWTPHGSPIVILELKGTGVHTLDRVFYKVVSIPNGTNVVSELNTPGADGFRVVTFENILEGEYTLSAINPMRFQAVSPSTVDVTLIGGSNILADFTFENKTLSYLTDTSSGVLTFQII